MKEANGTMDQDFSMGSMGEEDDVLELAENGKHDEDKPPSEKMVIARKETRAVKILRYATLCVLFGAAVVTTFMVYEYAHSQEILDFEQAFHYDATKALDTYKGNAKLRRDALEAFSTSITQFVMNKNMRSPGATTEDTNRTAGESSGFPFVTVPDFDRRAAYTLQSADVLGAVFLPRVSASQREAWQDYSVQNQRWIAESLAFQASIAENDGQSEDVPGPSAGYGNTTSDISVDPIQPYIYRFSENGEFTTTLDPELSFPMWQMAPAVDDVNIINFDAYSFLQVEIDTMLSTKNILLTDSVVIEPHKEGDDWKNTDEMDKTDFKQGYRYLVDLFLEKTDGKVVSAGGPVSFLMIPVFDEWNRQKRQVAGVLKAFLYWQKYLEYLLPDTSNNGSTNSNFPMCAVLESTCNQHFTYILRGPTASFVGEGDLHDLDFDDMMRESGHDAVIGFNITDAEPGECAVNLKIYPTAEMKESFTTMDPYVFALVVAFIFVFTSLIFACYDCLNQRRYRIVNTKAMEQTAVVSSLFPEEVRDQVVGIVEKNRNPVGLDSSTSPVGKWEVSADNYERLAAELDSSKPIANLYPHCTVLFADIAGFTAWSSERSPSEVFKLLETIYGAFDRIAKKKNVFKVETIGDCYVAVTGLPKPQEQHAVIMAKFAADCMTALSGMMHVLVEKLGSDTANLSMRFGLHSGPVTAGVLRGDRARFQLFGDTVNTASRMESNGQKGRIQASKSTADLLVAAGKQHWIKQREDTIQAKGKGEMTTYWIEIASITASSGTASTPRTSSLQESSMDTCGTNHVSDARSTTESSRQQHQAYKEILKQLKDDENEGYI